MISPISGSSPVQASQAAAQTAVRPQSSSSAPANRQDTVTLSSAARQASQAVDVDHDGDSH